MFKSAQLEKGDPVLLELCIAALPSAAVLLTASDGQEEMGGQFHSPAFKKQVPQLFVSRNISGPFLTRGVKRLGSSS